MTARRFKPNETVEFVGRFRRGRRSDGAGAVTGRPAMTIQAPAFRAADHIGQFAKRNEICER